MSDDDWDDDITPEDMIMGEDGEWIFSYTPDSSGWENLASPASCDDSSLGVFPLDWDSDDEYSSYHTAPPLDDTGWDEFTPPNVNHVESGVQPLDSDSDWSNPYPGDGYYNLEELGVQQLSWDDDDDGGFVLPEVNHHQDQPDLEMTFGDELFPMAGMLEGWDIADLFHDVGDGDGSFQGLSGLSWHSDIELNPDDTGYSCELGDPDPAGEDRLRRQRSRAQYERARAAGDHDAILEQLRADMPVRLRTPPRGMNLQRLYDPDMPGWVGRPADPDGTLWSSDESDCSSSSLYSEETESYIDSNDTEESDSLDSFVPMATSTPTGCIC